MKRCMLVAVLGALPVAAFAQGGAAAQQSVLVTTVTPQRGRIARAVIGYGLVQTAPGGSETMSVLRGVQVRQVLVAVGQTVRQGQALMTLGADAAAIASYKQAGSALALAQSERGRLEEMLAQHLATRDQVAQAAKAVLDAQANLEVLKSAGGDSVGQTLRAGFDGVVSALPATTGARVPAQTPLIVLERSNGLVVAVGVEPSRRAELAENQPARIDPLDGGGPAQDGAVSAIGGMLDQVTRLVPVLVRPAVASSLLPGGPVRASIRVGEIEGWLVPRDAVLTDAKGAYLFQVAAGKAARVDVQVAGMSGTETVVDGPVNPQRALVSSGNYQLQDGVPVRTGDPNSPPDTAGVTAK